MAKYRTALPQLSDKLFLTDSGLETSLIFHEGIDLPCFASFTLLSDPAGCKMLTDYYRRHAALARERRLGFVLESVTWRANPDWGAKLGLDAKALAKANREAIRMLEEVRAEMETPASPMPISGNIGPRGDGYVVGATMTIHEAERYHGAQIRVFADTAADYVSAFTLTYPQEAIGVVRAARTNGLPSVISFTVEIDGRLPNGMALGEAIMTVDDATDGAAAYFMVNCAHPTHFEAVFDSGEAWTRRIGGIRANASRRSHAELDNSADLDDGDPAELGLQYRDLLRRLPAIRVVGGCCGTDFRHVEQIGFACAALEAA